MVMMKKVFKDIVGAYSNGPAVVTAHGPSLNLYKEQIETLQKKNKILRFSVNEWFKFFSTAPDYWVIANNHLTIEDNVEIINGFKAPVFYADSVDLTDHEYVENNLKVDYLNYDQRHFKQKKCREIILSFKDYYIKNKNFAFKEYGNNDVMWYPPRVHGGAGFSGGVGVYTPGRNSFGRCCENINPNRLTIQEFLQKTTNYDKHYSTGDTVVLHAIAFAIIMGCNPIYIVGVDLDYSLGYAENSQNYRPDLLATRLEESNKNLLNDLQILKDSADMMGTKIINLNKESWYHVFEIGSLEE
jgi:hypothetical protein